MLHPVTFRLLVVAACGSLLACDALALSLGRVRGAVLIGRPLDVSIPVTLEAGEDSPCASGDLFYGDTRVARGVAVRWEPAASGQGTLRISSPVPVDEPMVTLYLKAGCSSVSTRRYVMLPELPPDNEPAARNTAPVPVPVPAPAARAAAPAPVRTAPPKAEAPTPAPAPVVGTRPSTEPAAPRRPARAAPARKEAAPQPRARLKLEPLDLSVDRDPVLRLSPEMQPPAASDPQRRQAAAALWQALQKDPEQSLQDALRLQNAERELKSLRDASQQNAAALAQLRAQVDQAQNSRQTATAMILALAVFLAGLLAWLAWRWRSEERVARVGRWFDANSELAEPPLPIVDAAAARRMTPMPPVPAPVPAAPVHAPAPLPASAAPAVVAARPPAPAPARSPAKPVAAPPSDWAPAEFQASRGTVRMVGVEELIDVHDKADFFLSIGEHEQAIGVLEAHVHDQVETSALAWMDLLELYHRFAKRARFEELRSAFQRRFTVQVPDFDHFDQPSESLEHYDRALGRIVALWPSRKVLEVIEESMFRQPGLPGAEPFSIEAYRDLVLLYHIAQDMAPPDRKSGPSTTFRDTSLQPLNAVDARASELDPLLIPPSSPRLGVDIDLDQAPTVPPHLPPEPLPMLDFDISGIESFELPKTDRKS